MFKNLKTFIAPTKTTIQKTLPGSDIIHAPVKETPKFCFPSIISKFCEIYQLTIGYVLLLYFCRLINCGIGTCHCSSDISFSTCKNCSFLKMRYTMQTVKDEDFKTNAPTDTDFIIYPTAERYLNKYFLYMYQSPKSLSSACSF